MAVADGGLTMQTELPDSLRDNDLESVIGVGTIGYDWSRDTPDELWLSVATRYQSQEITISAGDTIVGPDGEHRCTIDGFSVWTIDGDEWIIEICVPNEHSEIIPHSPAEFVIKYLGNEGNDNENVYELTDCKSLSDEELTIDRWSEIVNTLKSINEGDRVLWGDRSEPLTVTSTGLTFTKYIYLEGSRGGMYTIEWEDDIPTVRRNHNNGESLGRPQNFCVVSRNDSKQQK